MKKLLLFSSLLLSAVFSFGQNTVTTMTGSGATVTNSGTAACSTQVVYTHEQVSAQIIVTKTSGTVDGYALIYGSVDGTNYYVLNTDTLQLANQTTNTAIWPLTGANYLYYKIVVTGSGTMAATISGKLLTSGAKAKHAVSNMKSSYDLTSDTCTNAGTTYVGLTVNNYYETVTIQAVVTKISGTVAGTVTVQGSNDGTNFVTVDSDYITSSTLSPTNQTTNTKIFIITGSPYKYYRLSYTGSGTMSATLKGYVLPNK